VKRTVQAELLDTLPPDDPRAVRSRRDLRRVNGWMANHTIMAEALQNVFSDHAPAQLNEIGAGDGTFLLRVAQKIRPRSAGLKATLIDRQKNVSPKTVAAFTALGWNAEAIVSDIFAWPQIESDAVVANLFLHHFEGARLAELLDLVSRHTECFIAIEPRRGGWPLFCSRLLWAIGCNAVTRHDAVVSVRAGFSGGELSALWRDKQNWQITERRAGAFSHLFIARKNRVNHG
jgi:hypothetical protein